MVTVTEKVTEVPLATLTPGEACTVTPGGTFGKIGGTKILLMAESGVPHILPLVSTQTIVSGKDNAFVLYNGDGPDCKKKPSTKKVYIAPVSALDVTAEKNIGVPSQMLDVGDSKRETDFITDTLDGVSVSPDWLSENGAKP